MPLAPRRRPSSWSHRPSPQRRLQRPRSGTSAASQAVVTGFSVHSTSGEHGFGHSRRRQRPRYGAPSSSCSRSSPQSLRGTVGRYARPSADRKGWKVDLSQFGAQTIGVRNAEECRLLTSSPGTARSCRRSSHRSPTKTAVPGRPPGTPYAPCPGQALCPTEAPAAHAHSRGAPRDLRARPPPAAAVGATPPAQGGLTQSREVRELKTAQTQVVLGRGNVRDLPESRNRLILRCGQLEEHRSDSRHETRTYTSSPDPVTSAACTPRAARR